MKRIPAAWVSLIAMPALALAISPLALTACSGGSSDESAATETNATEDTETAADETATTDQDSEAEDAASEDDGEPVYVDELGTLNVRAIDELVSDELAYYQGILHEEGVRGLIDGFL